MMKSPARLRDRPDTHRAFKASDDLFYIYCSQSKRRERENGRREKTEYLSYKINSELISRSVNDSDIPGFASR